MTLQQLAADPKMPHILSSASRSLLAKSALRPEQCEEEQQAEQAEHLAHLRETLLQTQHTNPAAGVKASCNV
jgi:hypothetical protein